MNRDGDFWDYMSIYGTRRQPVTPPRPPQRARAPRCGVDCHRQERQKARLAGACCLLVIAFVTVVCVWPHHHSPAPVAPGWGNGGSSQIYPHNPGVGAAAVAGEARGAARVAGGAARWGFRGARIARGGGFYIPGTGGFHGYGFGIFSGF